MAHSENKAASEISKRNGTPRHSSPDLLLTWNDLLPWQKDNEFILTHYRKASFSWRKSLNSVGKIHNETVNIWSHGLGALFYGSFMLWTEIPHAHVSDMLALSIYYASVVVCFVLSSTFHTFLNHSADVWRTCSQLDHLGIVLVIWGSMIPSTYFGFYCDHHLRNTYWLLATTAALASAWATFQPFFRTPTGRKVRALLYSCLGASAFASCVHGVMINGWEEQNERQSLICFLGLGLLNFTGTLIYAARVPERWCPRTFDVWGSSHQLMHLLVVLGAYSHSIGLHKALQVGYHERMTGSVCILS